MKLREVIKNQEKERITNVIRRIADSKDPNTIWEIRKRILGRKRQEYDLITEEGNVMLDKEEAQEYIATYFEELYQAREGEEKEWTRTIIDKVQETAQKMKERPALQKISNKEMTDTIRKLKKKKSCGPDEIPNEVLIHADQQTQDTIKETLNKIMMQEEIPKSWKKGRIITLYKGKGTRGKCSNERGITLSSNIGKFFERIINERAKKEVKVSDMQGGGKKGANTVDHITTLQELIRKGKQVYITFLDVTKAYDKAWADGIMYVMDKQGLKSRLWMKIKKMNEGLSANVETKHGLTREIKMRDNIKQGGVLSVLMYATLMDEIAKEINKRQLGIRINPEKKIGCLLWMDDVAIITDKQEEMQEMLNIVNDTAKRYRIKFGQEKSKVLKIGNRLEKRKFYLGDMELEYCQKYKYLGVTMCEKNGQSEHLKDLRRKTEAAYNTITAIAGNIDFKHMELQAIWKFMESCIIPIATYGGEGLKMKRNETKDRQRILDGIIKRILMVPISTPREPLYYETGVMDIETIITRNKINYWKKMKERKNEILEEIRKDEDPKSWNKETESLAHEVIGNGMKTNNKHGWTRRVNKGCWEYMMNSLKNSGEKKTKVSFYLNNKQNLKPGNRAQYLDRLTRQEASAIFKARTRMTNVKSNYKKRYTDLTCRLCGKKEETQEHVLEECQGINRNENGVITIQDIFTEDLPTLRTTAKKLIKLKKIIDSAGLYQIHRTTQLSWACTQSKQAVCQESNMLAET
jgi:hypothetical protein